MGAIGGREIALCAAGGQADTLLAPGMTSSASMLDRHQRQRLIATITEIAGQQPHMLHAQQAIGHDYREGRQPYAQVTVSANTMLGKRMTHQRPESPNDDFSMVPTHATSPTGQTSWSPSKRAMSARRSAAFDEALVGVVGPTLWESHRASIISGQWRPKLEGKQEVRETSAVVVAGTQREIGTTYHIMDVPKEDCLHRMEVWQVGSTPEATEEPSDVSSGEDVPEAAEETAKDDSRCTILGLLQSGGGRERADPKDIRVQHVSSEAASAKSSHGTRYTVYSFDS